MLMDLPSPVNMRMGNAWHALFEAVISFILNLASNMFSEYVQAHCMIHSESNICSCYLSDCL